MRLCTACVRVFLRKTTLATIGESCLSVTTPRTVRSCASRLESCATAAPARKKIAAAATAMRRGIFIFFLQLSLPPCETPGIPRARSSHRGHASAPQNPSRARRVRSRSEEHTSELQSRLHLVCRLLLEKKKQYITTSNMSYMTPDLGQRRVI